MDTSDATTTSAETCIANHTCQISEDHHRTKSACVHWKNQWKVILSLALTICTYVIILYLTVSLSSLTKRIAHLEENNNFNRRGKSYVIDNMDVLKETISREVKLVSEDSVVVTTITM